MIRRIALLLLLAGAPCPAQDPSTQTESLPAVRPMQGDLLLWKASDGKAGPVARETRVAPADRLGTKDGDYAALSSEGGTVVALKGLRTGPDRGLGVERREKKLVFRVFEGKVAVQTFEQGVRIETPQGEITASNSYFLVEVEKDKTRVVTVDGAPTFTNSLGSVVIPAGRETVAESGKKASPPKATDAGKATEEFTRHEQATNLVRNAGFEDGLKFWDATYFFWQGKKQTELDATLPHSGRSCIRCDFSNKIQGQKPTPGRFAQQGIPVIAGRTYLFRVYLRSEMREGQITPRISLYNVEPPESWTVSCEKPWKLLTAVVTAKENVLGLTVEALFESDRYDGSLWVDDFLLTELPGGKPK
jgi:hypothetical protein